MNGAANARMPGAVGGMRRDGRDAARWAGCQEGYAGIREVFVVGRKPGTNVCFSLGAYGIIMP